MNNVHLENLSSQRLSLGTYSNGKLFTLVDSWRDDCAARRAVQHKWHGITCFFDRACIDRDELMDKICSLHDAHMPQVQNIGFADGAPEVHCITPYSEVCEQHPHFILATANGWKRNPSRADPYTGKSSAVMAQRKKLARKSLRSKTARQNRKSILNAANSISLEARNHRPHGPDT